MDRADIGVPAEGLRSGERSGLARGDVTGIELAFGGGEGVGNLVLICDRYGGARGDGDHHRGERKVLDIDG